MLAPGNCDGTKPEEVEPVLGRVAVPIRRAADPGGAAFQPPPRSTRPEAWVPERTGSA